LLAMYYEAQNFSREEIRWSMMVLCSRLSSSTSMKCLSHVLSKLSNRFSNSLNRERIFGSITLLLAGDGCSGYGLQTRSLELADVETRRIRYQIVSVLISRCRSKQRREEGYLAEVRLSWVERRLFIEFDC
jgi:hypothetical protein